LGEFLDDLTSQMAERAVANVPNRKLSGAEVVTVAKHVLHNGFAFEIAGKPSQKDPDCVALVLRGAARKDVRALFGRLIGTSSGPGKPQIVSKAGNRKVIVASGPTSKWAWWTEKDDVVCVLDRPESADVVIECLEGKRPNAVDQPTRAELAKADGDFQPVGLA